MNVPALLVVLPDQGRYGGASYLCIRKTDNKLSQRMRLVYLL